VGAGATRRVRPDVRGDCISWIEAEEESDSASFFDGLDDLRRLGNQELTLGLATLEMHFARFAPGCGYARHRDWSPHGVDRVVSLIYYLNRGWQPGDGGELEIETDEGLLLVEPRADTLVTFLSARFYHTVLPAVRERQSLAGWFHRRGV
jgi:SM-20-related protein